MSIRQQTGSRPRALRGLVLVFVLSLLSLFGVMLTATALGGAGSWTRWQFIGLFGLLECASGAANVILPNVWRLPVAEAQTSSSTKVRLAPEILLIPHWAATARSAAGALLLGGTLIVEGVGPGSVLLLICVVLATWLVIAASLVVARAGVRWPQHDVVQIVIVRPNRRFELPPVSIGASMLQFLLSIATIPVVKVLPPGVLYHSYVAPSSSALAVLVALSFAACAAVAWAWQGRIDVHASQEQRRDAQRYA